jgi:hypothetical protein
LARQTGTLDSGFPVGIELLLNDGFGVFEDLSATHVPFVSYVSQCMSTLDADGDGDVDVFLGLQGWIGSSNVLLVNNGEGVFVADSTRTPSGLASNVYTVEAADINGDGHMDLLADDRLWLGSVSGQFVDATMAMGLIHPKEPMYVGDFDGDGRLDLFRNSQPISVYRNTGTNFQLVNPGVADAIHGSGGTALWDRLGLRSRWRRGCRVRMGAVRERAVEPAPPLACPPSSRLPACRCRSRCTRRGELPAAPTLAVLVIGIGRERSETPWGVTWIDLAGPMGLHVMSVPWNTHATATLPIPPWLSLQGTQLTFQALVLEEGGAAPRLSNAITTTIR